MDPAALDPMELLLIDVASQGRSNRGVDFRVSGEA